MAIVNLKKSTNCFQRVCLSLKRLTWEGGKEAKLAQLELDVHVVVLHEGLVIQLASALKFGRINRTRGWFLTKELSFLYILLKQ